MKKKLFRRLIASLLSFILCLSLFTMTAFADLPEIQNVNISEDGILSWSPVEGADDYFFYLESGGGYVGNKESYNLKEFAERMGYGTGKYNVGLNARKDGREISQTWKGIYNYVSTQPKLKDPYNIQFDMGTSTLTWDGDPNTKEYTVCVFQNGSVLSSLMRYIRDGSKSVKYDLTEPGNYKFSIRA